MPLDVGCIVEGKVTGLSKFGAFILLPDGNTGLVHISEVSTEYVKDIKDHLVNGQQVKVKVLSDDGRGKIALSIRKALEGSVKKFSKPSEDWDRKNDNNLSFEDRLSKFLKESDERMSDLKKNFDSKRKNTGYRRMS